MHRKFIALILGLALAVTGVGLAAPARAETDLGKALAGLAALAILGVAIDRARSDDHSHATAPEHPQHRHGYGNGRRFQPVQRRLPQRVRQFDLPRACLKTYVVQGRRNQNLYDSQCLRQKYARAGGLPRACAAPVRIGGQTRMAYRPACLHGYGYRLAGR